MALSKVHLLLLVLFVTLVVMFPLDVFLNVLLLTEGKTYTYYLLVALSVFFLPAFRCVPNKLMVAVKVIVILACIYGLSFVGIIFAGQEYSTLMWYLYQFIFLFTSLGIALVYGNLTEAQNDRLACSIQRMLQAMSYGVFVVASLLLVSDGSMLFDGSVLNSYIARLNHYMLWEKQAIGNVLAIIILYLCILSSAGRMSRFLVLVPALPLGVGIRTLWLGMISSAVFVRLKGGRMLLLLAGTTSLVALALLGDGDNRDRVKALVTSDIRVLAYLNTFDIISRYPFGVGLGGYHVYSKEYGDDLLSEFSAVTTTYSFLSVAPESDIVFVFSSLGFILGTMHYMVLIWVLISVLRRYSKSRPLDRFFLSVFVYFFFSGISQDNMFGFVYWVFLGFALGSLGSVEFSQKRLKERAGTSLSNPALAHGV